jgi:hypothetical protein
LEKGKAGEWDYLIGGGLTGTAVKKDGKFYLYYQGASGYDIKYETVTYRAIGLATSSDGVKFSKYTDNPVITWFPNNWIEEGAVSGGATVLPDGEIIIYYGTNTKQSDWLVNADGRLAVSKDGLNFSDAGMVLNHRERMLWGFGDELFPIMAFYDKDCWYVYYIPNGTPQSHSLGVAWGPHRDCLAHSGAVRAGDKDIEAWGMGGYAKVGEGTYALFINNVKKSRMEVRTVDLEFPDRASQPLRVYAFHDFAQGTVLLDRETNTWFMYYRTGNQEKYHAKSAPVRELND